MPGAQAHCDTGGIPGQVVAVSYEQRATTPSFQSSVVTRHSQSERAQSLSCFRPREREYLRIDIGKVVDPDLRDLGLLDFSAIGPVALHPFIESS